MASEAGFIAGIAMVLVGLLAIIYWRISKHSRYSLFIYGGVFWFVAFSIKMIMDLTITPALQATLLSNMPVLLGLVTAGVIVGVRTGVLECGVTYLGAWLKKFGSLSFDDSVALGIGFGAIEAIYLGLMVALSAFIMMADPAAWDVLPESIRLTLMPQSEAWYVLVSAVERFSAVMIHAFTTVLVIYSLKLNDLKWLLVSIAFKSPFDMVVPVFNYYNFVVYKGSLRYVGYVIVEAVFLAIAAVSLYGLIWLKKKYPADDLKKAETFKV
jgi:uncharacterized membrane protein YhfC